MRLWAAALLLTASPALAQVTDATGARLRLLDKLTGEITDITLANGASQTVARLTVQVDACRYPADNPTAEAYAHVTVHDVAAAEPVFKGWMVASSPGLSALDHPRYDVWVLRCDVPDLVLPEVAPAPEGEEEGAGEATEDGNG
ncbi:MAG: DUF2155 domain-containing protein [Rhodobacteraceae bacterium]|nr:DUF2155 domain-containing protein [Paracoccaceae bacterium]